MILINNKKNKKAIDFINNNNINMTFMILNNTRRVSLSKNGKELGFFTIDGRPNIDTMDMTIYIEETENLIGRGLAKLMIAYMLICMVNENIRKDQLVYIDTDASDGFWAHIGMQENRYYSRGLSTIIGRGYEMFISFSKLAKWAL